MYDNIMEKTFVIVIEYTTPRIRPNVNYGLWEMTCELKFFDCNKRTTPVQDIDSGEVVCVCVCM